MRRLEVWGFESLPVIQIDNIHFGHLKLCSWPYA